MSEIHIIFRTNRMRWTGTVFYLIGMVLAAFNKYPENLFFGAVGGILWCAVGLRIRDVPLWLVEAAAALIYLAGIVAYFWRM